MYKENNDEKGVTELLNGELTSEKRTGLECLLSAIRAGESSDSLRKRADLAHSEFDRHLSNAISFMEKNYGNGPETVFLLTGLLSCSSVVLVSTPGNPLYELNDRLLIRGRDRRMQEVG